MFALTSILPAPLRTAEGLFIWMRSARRLLPKAKYKNVSGLFSIIMQHTFDDEKMWKFQKQVEANESRLATYRKTDGYILM